MKLAIVLFNLGGPDHVTAIEPFLFNLFSDKAIISVPQPFRWLLAKYISLRRAPVAAEIYAHLGGKSPLLDLTKKQADALNLTVSQQLGENVEINTFISMRYWHPMSEECAKNVKEFNPDHVVLLPLYPQFSTTTTGSSLKNWHKAARKVSLKAKVTTICCYPENEGFIEAMVENLLPQIEEIRFLNKPRILFSAHGLPKKIIDKGDPYQSHVEKTALAIVKKLNIPSLDWWVSYQSRVGPLEWIGPNTEDEIERAGREKVPLIIVPVSFVSEHSETLVELDIEYREVANNAGVPAYMRTPAVGTHPSFIKGLSQLVLDHIGDDLDIKPDGKIKICEQKHSACICQD